MQDEKLQNSQKKNIGRTFNDINQGMIFYDPHPRAMEVKMKVKKWDLIKSFCTAKETIQKVKRQPTEWQTIIASETADKGLIFKI